MGHDDTAFAAARREIALHAAAHIAQPADSPRESGSGVPATVGGIPITSAMLLPADHLDAESAWNQHIPFAFWLVQAHWPAVFVELGTYRGTSYFSFCQAVAALRLPTRCFAIDTWQGDSHSGFYDESVFARVRACNERKYAGFSRLVRSCFDEALPHFLDGSIDLLHIDGLHTYEACRHDFESWLPKLSRRAIVLFHDTNVRERGFGVHRLWAELIEHYPHFEFVHEHGLGVLGVGAALDAPVRELFAAADDAALTCEIRSAFWRLGSVVRTEVDLKASGAERARLETLLSTTISEYEIEVSRLTAEQAQLRLSLEEKEGQAADLTVQCAVVRREKAELGMALAAAHSERVQLDTALSVARSEQAELGTALAAARSENADLGTAIAAARSENADLGTAIAAARSENADLGTAIAAARSENADLGTAIAAARGENADLGTAIAAARSENADLRTVLATALNENADLDAALAAAREEGADRRAALDARTAELSAVRIRAERAEAALAAARKELDAIGRSTSWRITRPLRQIAARCGFARHIARMVKRFRWIVLANARLQEYFVLRAKVRLIAASGLFDCDWYLAQYPDLCAARVDPLVHYLRHGAAEGRDPNPLFDSDWYLDRYPDVRAAGVNPLVHYLCHGAREGRDPNPLFDSDWYLGRYPDVRAAAINPLVHYFHHGAAEERRPSPLFDGEWYLDHYADVRTAAVNPLAHYLRHGADEGREASPLHHCQKWVETYDTILADDRVEMRQLSKLFPKRPLVSVVMPTYNTPEKLLREAIESVRFQTYDRWELCIADDCSTEIHVRRVLAEYAQADPRIKVIYRKENGHISRASNSALELADGEWLVLLDHDDLLAPHALFCVVDAVNRHKDVMLIYSDEDKIGPDGARREPYFKSNWNPDLFLSQNMFSHLGAYKRDLVTSVGGFRPGFEGSQDYDLTLRCVEAISDEQIYHIPHVLYHWRIGPGSAALNSNEKPYAMLAAERALNEHLDRREVHAKAKYVEVGYRVRYEVPHPAPQVTLIIPTRNERSLLERCISSILKLTTYPNYDIIIIDNGSDDARIIDYFEELRQIANIQIKRDDRPFNYSMINNTAAASASGSIIGLINNDIEVISPDWLTEMVSLAVQPGVGAVGARLWYPNDTIQHAGVIIGIGGVAGHAHRFLKRGVAGYFGRAALIQSFSAVTGACLVVCKDLYIRVGGLNEDLAIAFNDIDFCLKLRQMGYRNLWTPYAELYHHESASRGVDDTPQQRSRFEAEAHYMRDRWGESLHSDPAYSPNLTLDRSNFSLAFPPRVDKPWRVRRSAARESGRRTPIE
jgi:O-antigen biosynthesis protein